MPLSVIYISGEGRSGSTLLDRILGILEGVSSFNEIYELWKHGFLGNGKCACGQEIKACSFWAKVSDEVIEKHGRPEELLKLQDDVDTFDLMPPADDYKLYWARHEKTVQVFISRVTAWGRIAKLLYNSNLRGNAIGFYRYLPGGFRRFVVRLLANKNFSMDGLRLICSR